MYDYLIESRIKRDDEYDWFVYKGSKPITVKFRNNPVTIDKGTKFGVRPSSDGKSIRLVLENDLTRVITIDLATAKKLATKI